MLIDPTDRVLLVKLEVAATNWVGWVLPGGGIEPGEDHHTALRRELLEEVGAGDDVAFIGPPLWIRQHRNRDVAPGWDGQEETVYLVPSHTFEPAPQFSAEELAAEHLTEIRWWTMAELRATTEVVRPSGLADHVARILEFGAPDQPRQLGSIE